MRPTPPVVDRLGEEVRRRRAAEGALRAGAPVPRRRADNLGGAFYLVSADG
jgi:hypothetical protein